jgi:hypothetical protein
MGARHSRPKLVAAVLALPLKSQAGKPNKVCWEHLCDPAIEESVIVAPAGYRWSAALARALAAAADPELVAEAVAWDQVRLEAEKAFEAAPAPTARLAAAAQLAILEPFAEIDAPPQAAAESGSPAGQEALVAAAAAPGTAAAPAAATAPAAELRRSKRVRRTVDSPLARKPPPPGAQARPVAVWPFLGAAAQPFYAVDSLLAPPDELAATFAAYELPVFGALHAALGARAELPPLIDGSETAGATFVRI